jgi:hypothetical protein
MVEAGAGGAAEEACEHGRDFLVRVDLHVVSLELRLRTAQGCCRAPAKGDGESEWYREGTGKVQGRYRVMERASGTSFGGGL